MPTKRILVSILGLLLAGCANVPREAGFGDVEKTVADRTGKRVHWRQGNNADREVSEIVSAMLRKELTADEMVQIALLSNRNLQATYEDLMIAQADLVEAGLLSNPIFDTEIRIFDGGVSSESAVVQNFLEILYLPLRKRVAEARFEATKLRVAGEVMDLAGEVRSAFYGLQASQQKLELRRQVLTATEAGYDLAQRMRRAGNITELDLINERSLYEQSKVNVEAAEAEVRHDRERLNELMGVWGGETKWGIAQRLPEVPQEALRTDGLERMAIERSLDLNAMRNDITAAVRVLGVVRPFAAFPFLDAGISAEGETDGKWGLGPALSLPIPLFNQGQPAIAKAEAEYRRTSQRYAALAVTIRARVRAARDAVISARDRANHYRHVILPIRGQIVDQTQLQYNAMQVSTFQLLIAKQQQIDAGAEYIETLQEFWQAKAELDQLLSGRLAPVERRQPGAARSALRLPGMGAGAIGQMGRAEQQE